MIRLYKSIYTKDLAVLFACPQTTRTSPHMMDAAYKRKYRVLSVYGYLIFLVEP